MTTTLANPPAAPPALGLEALAVWREWIEEQCGACFPESRTHVLESCLRDRMRATGSASQAEYFGRVVRGDPTERRALVDRVLNHETGFFRHQPSYDALRTGMLPALTAAQRGLGRPRRIELWSAGSSTGEEAYSMAITALEVLLAAAFEFTVTGTDFTAACVEAARVGRYERRSMEGLAAEHRGRYFRPAAGHPGSFEAARYLRNRAEFGLFNFLRPETYPKREFHVIFCQNVLIYLREEIRNQVAREVCGRLAPGGYLVPAPGELPSFAMPGIEAARFGPVLVYRRKPEERVNAKRVD
ncbi:MAG: protein-glutamate O-methyltransferase CheR [Bryobacteraceae bacterium]